MDMPRRIRLVISDVDGTLLNSQGLLSQPNYHAIRRACQAGLRFSLSSARPSYGMFWLIQMLEIECTCSGLNGAILFAADGRVISECELDGDTVGELADRMRQHGLDVWLYTGGQWFVPRLNGSHVRRNAESLRTGPQLYGKLSDVSDPVLKIVGTSDLATNVAICESELRKEFGDRIRAARSQPHYLDITHPSADKGQAALAIAIVERVQMDEVATIGDSPADVPMFQTAGISIAMGQATDEVRRAATQVTRTNDENGVAWAIDYLLSAKALLTDS
jgi:Cof subfamily protein (haloacid dehalogenase superfamily)